MKDLLITLAVAACGFGGTLLYLWESPKAVSPSPTVVVAPPAPVPSVPEPIPAAPPVVSPDETAAERVAARPPSATKEVADLPAPAEPETQATAPLPVSMKFRRRHPGNEYQAGLVNSSTQTLPLEVMISNSQGKQINQQVQAAPGTGMSLGAAQGWELESGDEVTLRAVGYEELTARVP